MGVLVQETDACASVTAAFLQVSSMMASRLFASYCVPGAGCSDLLRPCVQVLQHLHTAESSRVGGPKRNILQSLSTNTRRTKVVELSSGTHRCAAVATPDPQASRPYPGLCRSNLTQNPGRSTRTPGTLNLTRHQPPPPPPPHTHTQPMHTNIITNVMITRLIGQQQPIYYYPNIFVSSLLYYYYYQFITQTFSPFSLGPW